ncbi:MAG: HNH endonuclease, partial [Anaerovoracaceae bacterium]
IPAKHCIAFADNNKQNCSLENLRCIPMRINAILNNEFKGMRNEESIDSLILMAEIMITARKSKKGKE